MLIERRLPIRKWKKQQYSALSSGLIRRYLKSCILKYRLSFQKWSFPPVWLTKTADLIATLLRLMRFSEKLLKTHFRMIRPILRIASLKRYLDEIEIFYLLNLYEIEFYIKILIKENLLDFDSPDPEAGLLGNF